MTIPPIAGGPATTNLVRNPSAETDLTGILTGSGGQPPLERVAQGAVDGAWAVKVTCDLASGFQGVIFESTIGLGFTGAARSFVGSVSLSGNGTLASFTLRVLYTDTTFVNAVTRSNIALSSTPIRVATNILTLDPAKTVSSFRLMAYQPSTPTVPLTFYADAAQIEEGTEPTQFVIGTATASSLPGFLRIGSSHIGPLRVGKV